MTDSARCGMFSSNPREACVPLADLFELKAAVHRYLQVDGSQGLFDAIECGRARRALVELAGDPERLTLEALRERWRESEEASR